MIVGYTVGVFDMFHDGHRNLLTYCGERCDYLIVALVTDDLTRVQKGHDRPAWSYNKRLITVRKWPTVSRVVRFESVLERDMLAQLAFTDVWFRGENQTNMPLIDWPGIHWVPETPGVSTTLLIREGEPRELRPERVERARPDEQRVGARVDAPVLEGQCGTVRVPRRRTPGGA